MARIDEGYPHALQRIVPSFGPTAPVDRQAEAFYDIGNRHHNKRGVMQALTKMIERHRLLQPKTNGTSSEDLSSSSASLPGQRPQAPGKFLKRCIRPQRHSTFGDWNCRVALDHRHRRNRGCHHAPRCDDSTLADLHVGEYDYARPNERSFADSNAADGFL